MEEKLSKKALVSITGTTGGLVIAFLLGGMGEGPSAQASQAWAFAFVIVAILVLLAGVLVWIHWWGSRPDNPMWETAKASATALRRTFIATVGVLAVGGLLVAGAYASAALDARNGHRATDGGRNANDVHAMRCDLVAVRPSANETGKAYYIFLCDAPQPVNPTDSAPSAAPTTQMRTRRAWTAPIPT